MNNFYLYLVAYPTEALVASMLPPEDFAVYMAVGPKRLSSGQILFLEIDPNIRSDRFDLNAARQRCSPHTGGEAKKSVYVSIYRAMELLPYTAFGDLHLVTKDGRTLKLSPVESIPEHAGHAPFLYQEICPVRPLVASNLAPADYIDFMSTPSNPIHVPRILFCDLHRGSMKEHYIDDSLPYRQIEHIRACLEEVTERGKKYQKKTKTVGRTSQDEFLYRTIAHGFYLGDAAHKRFYPFPSKDDIRLHHYPWLRSAMMD